MSLAFPAIATRIVQKRLIREWLRQVYELPDRPGSTITYLEGYGSGGFRLRVNALHRLWPSSAAHFKFRTGQAGLANDRHQRAYP